MLPGAVQALLAAVQVIPAKILRTLHRRRVPRRSGRRRRHARAAAPADRPRAAAGAGASRAATLNAATRIGRRDLGLVAPGRRADFFVASDLEQLEIRDVFASGRQVARDGEICIDINAGPTALPAPTMHVPPLRQDQFRLTVSGSATRVRVRTVDKPRFTEWGEMELEVRDGAAVLPRRRRR